MHDQPEDPREEAREADALDVRDRLRPADGGEVALVDVAERRGRAGRGGARGRHARRSGPAASRPARARATGRCPVAGLTATMSPSASTSGCPASVRSGRTGIRPARSTSRPASAASFPARPEALTPAAQTVVRASTRWTAPVGDRIATESPATSTTAWPTSGVTPSCSSARSALCDSDGGNCASTRSAASTRRTRAARVSKERKSRRSASRASSAIWPAISTPVGPAPTTTNVSHASTPRRIGLDLRRLEGGQHPAADLERTLERLQLGRVRAPFVVAEVGVVRAAGDDQRVVGERRRCCGRWPDARAAPRAARGRTRSPRPVRPARSADGAGPPAGAWRSPRAPVRRSRPGRRAAGTG